MNLFKNLINNYKNNNLIKEKEKTIDILDSDIQDKTNILNNLREEILENEKELEQYRIELNYYNGLITMEELGIEYKPAVDNLNKIQKEIQSIQEKIGTLISSNNAIVTTRIYRIDGSESKGIQFQKLFCENLLIGFNSYFNKKKKSVTPGNIKKSIELIEKKFLYFNKKASMIGVSVNEEYLDLCIQLLYSELDLKILKETEREKIKEEKRKIKEQEKLLEEAERDRKKLLEERKNLQRLFAHAVTEKEQEEIRLKLAEVDKRTEEIDWRISHHSAGWLYIATTPCLENMYKAGCTRQLNPLNRLAQLSSASVPYPFQCRGLVFSENVFDLEAKLHQRLEKFRVNKINRGKEFFYGDPNDAIKILQYEFHVEVHFIDENWTDNNYYYLSKGDEIE